MTASPTAPQDPPIVFFDGVCGLCNKAVDFLVRRDRRRTLRYAPLQGETARRLLPALGNDRARWSMLLLDADGLHDQSEAALRVARRLGGFLTVLSWARIVPRFLRDPVYRFVARNRYRWFGEKESCRIPSPTERALFLP